MKAKTIFEAKRHLRNLHTYFLDTQHHTYHDTVPRSRICRRLFCKRKLPSKRNEASETYVATSFLARRASLEKTKHIRAPSRFSKFCVRFALSMPEQALRWNMFGPKNKPYLRAQVKQGAYDARNTHQSCLNPELPEKGGQSPKIFDATLQEVQPNLLGPCAKQGKNEDARRHTQRRKMSDLNDGAQ